ncbi:hypothetical protein [Streptomyces sp. NPDC058412]|uniref:hypothetical protein n=1 Tax=Streptomyces sp. NPDC058412 TaxID=3346486 RepID=UPI00365D80E7
MPELTEADGVDLIAAATSMADTFWNIATPGNPGPRRGTAAIRGSRTRSWTWSRDWHGS